MHPLFKKLDSLYKSSNRDHANRAAVHEAHSYSDHCMSPEKQKKIVEKIIDDVWMKIM